MEKVFTLSKSISLSGNLAIKIEYPKLPLAYKRKPKSQSSVGPNYVLDLPFSGHQPPQRGNIEGTYQRQCNGFTNCHRGLTNCHQGRLAGGEPSFIPVWEVRVPAMSNSALIPNYGSSLLNGTNPTMSWIYIYIYIYIISKS